MPVVSTSATTLTLTGARSVRLAYCYTKVVAALSDLGWRVEFTVPPVGATVRVRVDFLNKEAMVNMLVSRGSAMQPSVGQSSYTL